MTADEDRELLSDDFFVPELMLKTHSGNTVLRAGDLIASRRILSTDTRLIDSGMPFVFLECANITKNVDYLLQLRVLLFDDCRVHDIVIAGSFMNANIFRLSE